MALYDRAMALDALVQPCAAVEVTARKVARCARERSGSFAISCCGASSIDLLDQEPRGVHFDLHVPADREAGVL